MEQTMIREIEHLHKRLNDLEHLLGDPHKAWESALSLCAGILTMVERLQTEQEKSEEASISIRAEVNSLLQALEKTSNLIVESEGRYRKIVESQSELICRFTPEGTITFRNEAFRQYFSGFGESLNEPGVISRLPEKDRALIQEQIMGLSPEKPSTKIEYHVQMPNGDRRWQQWSASGNFDENGNLLEILAVGHDITNRKRTELAANQHNRELLALHNATAALLTTLDPDALLGRILDSAISAIPAAVKGMIHLIAQDTGQLEMRASIGYTDPRIRRIKVPGSAGYVAKAVRERTALLFRDIQSDPALYSGKFLDKHVVHAAIVAPLILKSQVLGALSLESEQVGAFNQSDLRLLASFAATATAAIHNARLHAEVQKMAITDELTGLYNRRGFYELGQREVERARRFKRPLAAVMMDLDHFKYVNDAYGHAIGDQVLKGVAERCLRTLRRIDILGRMGGDEFTILLPETNMYTARGVAERLRRKIVETPIDTEKAPVSISASLGVARATAATPDLDVLISRADAAMYTAKDGGRNRVDFG